jgi:hypothetical protein
MSDLKQRALRFFQAMRAGHPLARLVYQVIQDYPDPFVMANQEAARIITRRTGKSFDPRFVWWHQFATAVSSTKTYNGWRHSGAPVKSLRMTDLVIARFDLFFQDATDQLDLQGGFYRQGANAGTFDERNEVRMLAVDVQQDLWALDFAELYRAQVARFWSDHGDDFPVLAKINLLGQAAVALRAGLLDATDVARVRDMAARGLDSVLPTVEQLRQGGSRTVLEVNHYGLGHADRASFYSLHAADGRVMLYQPWASEALRRFDSDLAMAAWLRRALQDTTIFEQFLAAAQSDPLDAERNDAARIALQSVADAPSDAAAQTLLAYLRTPIAADFFTRLAVQSRREMEAHADAIPSNSQLRRRMGRGYLSAFINTFGGLAPLGWPVSLSLLGAGLIKLGLDVDTAARAADDQTRRQALLDAMLDSVFGALNLTDLAFQSSFATLAYQPPFHESNALISHWRAIEQPDPLLAEFASSRQLIDELIEEGPLRGVQVHADGSTWITLNDQHYRVRYSDELSTWLIVPAEAAEAYAPLRPVRLGTDGEWQVLEPPRSLAGDTPPAVGFGSEPSPFWDTYTQVDQVRSMRLSANARVRQKKLLKGLPTLGADQLPAEDGDKIYCVMVDGVPEYSYLHEGDGYRNELIDYYTDESSQVNKVLRSGVYEHDDVDSYIAKLADTLERLPKSNAVTLYRGGSDARNTGGRHFRSGRVGVGDILINTDLTSFTENPYIVPEFSATLASDGNQQWVFDDSSVIYELPAASYHSGTPISAFSMMWEEAETLFLPGNYFEVSKVEQVYGNHYHFIRVVLKQTTRPAQGPVYDLRTGQLFDRATFSSRIRTTALAERFFPVAP